MAEALVSFVLEKTRDSIWEKLKEEGKLVLGVHTQVQNLATTLRSLQVYLRDADVRQVNDAGVKAWLQELKDAAYDADDVLDEWRTTILLSQLDPVTPTFAQNIIYYLISLCSSQPHRLTSSTTQQMKYYLFSPCVSCIPASCSCLITDDLAQHHRIANEIQGINEILGQFADNNTRFGFKLTEIPIHQSLPLPWRATCSLVNVAEIFGREDDKELIVDWLHGDHSGCTSVPVLSIVAFGGFGKTALAQIVFKQEKTKFEQAIWVCVSEPFDREKVAKEIIQGATGNKARDFDGWNALHQQLFDSIEGKKFLIVLDDVWSEDREDWAPFRLSLNRGAQGSRVIVTTRHKNVAIMMDSSKIHPLGGLSNQNCWLLFQQIAFAGRFAERSQEERETLKAIGEKIAAKCKGVPLAVKTIAGLMKFKHTKGEWDGVSKSDIWELKQGKHGFLPSLLLSYHDLTPDLKQCFLYCAIFLKDDIIEKDMLVKLWMAHGFLGLDGDKMLETDGERIFDELAMRSFFQDFEEDNQHKIINCKMHDLVHDFAQFLTKTECSILEKNDSPLNSEKVLHINAVDKGIESIFGFNMKKLRSLILRQPVPILSELFCQVTCLRSLDLSFSDIVKLPDAVKRLLHLRYLDLSYTELTELPETMCDLYNLQTLKFIQCCYHGKLPERFGRLSNLRHLECEALSYFPQGFGKLKHLRTLHNFVVSNASGGCKLEELEDLNLIRGKLKINGLRQVENIDEAKRANLQGKENIVSLTMSFDGESEQMITSEENENNMEKRMEEIIEGLQPHNNLEQLVILDYPGLAFPSWMSTMSKIVKLDLFDCPKLKALPATISKLPSLDCLRLSGMCWGGDILGICGFVNGESVPLFPKLTTLELSSMNQREEEIHEETIAPTISIMPSLRYLSILRCKKLKVIPNYLFSHNLRDLEICDCPELIGMSFPSNLPSLESLVLKENVGVFSRSLTPIIGSNNNHNLKSFRLSFSPHSSLPQGLNHFKSLQELVIEYCARIDFNPDEELSSEHFPNLRKLIVRRSPILNERCSKVNWSNLSQISEIEIPRCLLSLFPSRLNKF